MSVRSPFIRRETQRQVSLDSTVFRNRQFIEWLSTRKDIRIRPSIIVYLETLYWFLRNGLSIKDFDSEVRSLRGTVEKFEVQTARTVAEVAVKNKNRYDFRGHVRDYIVGVSAARAHSSLISDDLSGFDFTINGTYLDVVTPFEFVAEVTYTDVTRQ